MTAPVIRQASCVAIGPADALRAVLIEGAPGSGKSSLALALIDRGAVLVGDDGVALEQRDGRLWAAPPPNIGGMIEIRNVGIANLATAKAPVGLVIHLDEQAPRYPGAVETVEIAHTAVPLVRLWPQSPVLHLRAEWALRLHGLA